MDFKIKKFKNCDKLEILCMMEEFYSSDAVFTNGSREIFCKDFEECLSDSPFLEGYKFIRDSEILGYAMIAKSFSTEFGKKCIWLEDLYLKPENRGQGIIPIFIKYIETLYSDSIFRLEVESDNYHAQHVYQKSGFSVLPYMELKKDVP